MSKDFLDESPLYSIETVDSTTISENQFDDLREFVDKQISNSSHPAIDNMREDNENGFLYNIKFKTRWNTSSGQIAILRHNTKIIGISAVEKSQLHEYLSIGGIRCWLEDGYRNDHLVTNYLLNSNLEWSKANNMWSMMLTFNDYNKSIYEGVKRKSLGKSAGIGKIWSDWWNDCLIIDNTVNIRYTEQWCVLKPILNLGSKLIQSKFQGRS